VRFIEFSEIMLKAMAALNIEIKMPEFVSKIVKEISVKISVITMGNTLFVTERAYIVLRDLDSCPGDGIFILYQGDALLMLHKTRRKIGASNAKKLLCRLIYDFMVQIIMYGEAVDTNLEIHLVDTE
jgi:hypothetical protein